MTGHTAVIQDLVRNRRRVVLLYLSSVVLVSSMLFFYIWQFVRMRDVEKLILDARVENSALKEEVDQLTVEKARLGRLGRVESIATGKLGMGPPTREQIWYLPAAGTHDPGW